MCVQLLSGFKAEGICPLFHKHRCEVISSFTYSIRIQIMNEGLVVVLLPITKLGKK